MKTTDHTGPVWSPFESSPDDGAGIDAVVAALQSRLDELPPELAHRRAFVATYARTTMAIGTAWRSGRFEDPGWVQAWDVAFAQLYLDAHDADLAGAPVPRPWRLAFAAQPAKCTRSGTCYSA